MNTAHALASYLANHATDDWVENSDAYQQLLEECGDDLVPCLIDLLQHPSPDVRATCVALLATRRPHTTELLSAVQPLIFDEAPLVRTRVWEHLIEFGKLAESMAGHALQVVDSDRQAEDQYPRVAAIRFLLNLDEEKYRPILQPLLVELLDANSDAVPLILSTLMELNGVEIRFEDGPEGVE